MYADPSLGLGVAALPNYLTAQGALAKQQKEQVQQDKGGLLGAIAKFTGKTDAWLSNIPGWGVAKEAVSYPLDKTASAFRTVYSNAISQPISALLLQTSKWDLEGEAPTWSSLKDTWKNANNISPG